MQCPEYEIVNLKNLAHSGFRSCFISLTTSTEITYWHLLRFITYIKHTWKIKEELLILKSLKAQKNCIQKDYF